jgi:hypothetical protein
VIDNNEAPFLPMTTLFPFRGNRDEAMNAFYPRPDTKGAQFNSSDPGAPQRWISMMTNEQEADLLIQIADAAAIDEELSVEARYLAQKLGELFRASIQCFADYEERKAADLPTSLPVAS